MSAALGLAVRALQASSKAPAGLTYDVLLREGFQATGTSIGASNASGALSIGETLGGVGPIQGHCLWVESISMHSAIDIFVWVQRADSSLIANGAALGLNPVAVGPTFGSPIVPVNDLIREGESITFMLRTAVPSGSGTDTLQFRAGFKARRLTNDLAFEAPKTWLVIGDSITNTAISNASSGGTSFGSDFYHAQLARELRAAGKHYRRIVKGDGGWKTSHAVYAMQRGWFDVAQADLITIMLGTNETLLSDFQTNLPLLVSYLQDTFPNAQKVIIGPPPRQDSVETTLMGPLRDWTASYVDSLNDDKVRFTSVGAAFDRTNALLYLASDGAAGTRVHPIASAHGNMKDVLLADWGAVGLLARL